MPNALRTTAEVRADIARKLHEAGRMTVTDPAYEDVHADLDRLCEELAVVERPVRVSLRSGARPERRDDERVSGRLHRLAG